MTSVDTLINKTEEVSHVLRNNKICKVNRQHFSTMEEVFFKENLFNSVSDALMPLGDMFVNNSDMCFDFAYQTNKFLMEKGYVDEDYFAGGFEMLARYGVLMSGFVFAYDTWETDVSKAFKIYTLSISKLRELANMGVLKGKKDALDIELATIEKKMYGDRLKKSLSDGNYYNVVRLDFTFDPIEGVSCTATVPRDKFTLDRYTTVAYEAVEKAYETMTTLLNSKVLCVGMGEKQRIITFNRSLLASIYGESRAEQICTQRNSVMCGRYYVPVVGESIFNVGVTNIRIEQVDSVRVLESIAEIDLSKLNVNYALYADFMRSLSDDEAISLTSIGDADEAHDYLNSLDSRQLYDLYELNSHHLDTSRLDDLKKFYGNMYEVCDLPRSKEELDNRLKSGLYKITIIKRKGTYSTMYLTNNSNILQSLYGDFYMVNLESDGVRLRYLLNELDALDDSDEDGVYDAIMDWNLGDLIDNSLSLEEAKSAVRLELAKIKTATTVVKQPNLVMGRNVKAKVSSEFYKNVDYMSVVEMVLIQKA